MKKKIAIVSKKMITGGVERALIAMLNLFDYDTVTVDLYFEQLGGELYKELPDQANAYLIPRVNNFRTALRHPIHTLTKLINKWKLLHKNLTYIEQCHLSSTLFLPVLKQYDIAISYHAPNSIPVFYVIDSMVAKKKILWLHGDLHTNAGFTNLAKLYHSSYDHVIAVSKHVEESFRYYHPFFSGKISTVYNPIDAQSIRQKAKEKQVFLDDFQGTRIVSVGRLDNQKGFDLAVKACRRVIDKGFSIRWYVCGEGAQRRHLEKLISVHNLKDSFILLGNCSNPYPYISQCNLYVQCSRYEGYCTTTNEAKQLCKAIITTDVAGAREQFVDGKNGWIVPIDINKLADKIAWCIMNKDEISRVETCLAQENIAISPSVPFSFD